MSTETRQPTSSALFGGGGITRRTRPVPSAIERVQRWAYVALGALSVVLGAIGIFLPGLPTTVFMIVACWFFTRSCPRLREKLVAHPRLGKTLRAFLEDRTMPMRAKGAALLSMWLGIGTAMALAGDAAFWVRAALLGSGIAGTSVLLLFVRTRGVDPLILATQTGMNASHRAR